MSTWADYNNPVLRVPFTEAEANDAATAMADVGYDVKVEPAQDGGYQVNHVDNSGYRSTVGNKLELQEALDYMASEGHLIAEGLSGRY